MSKHKENIIDAGPYSNDPEEANTGWRNDYAAWNDVRDAIARDSETKRLQAALYEANRTLQDKQKQAAEAEAALQRADIEYYSLPKDSPLEGQALAKASAARRAKEAADDAVKAAEASKKGLETAYNSALRTLDTRQDRQPALPPLNTTARKLFRLNPITQQIEEYDNPNYTPPRETGGGGSGAALMSAQLAAERFAWEKAKYEEEQARKLALDERSWEQGVGPGYERQKDIDFANWQRQQDVLRSNTLADQQRQAEESWKRTLYEQEQSNARNRQAAQVNLSDSIARNWLSALPYAATPGQTHFLGFEPGGPYEQLVRMGGGTYSGDTYRAPVKEYDYENAWRQAAGLVGR